MRLKITLTVDVPPHLRGLGAEQASREAEKLVREAAERGNWESIIDVLAYLRAERSMRLHGFVVA